MEIKGNSDDLQEQINLLHKMINEVNTRNKLALLVTEELLKYEIKKIKNILLCLSIVMLLLAICLLIMRFGG